MEDESEALAGLRARLENFLEGKPYYFNPDTDTLESILRATLKRRERYGEDYCPCRRVTGDAEKDKAIICPCVYHPDEIKKDGHCHCNLFTSL